MLLLQKCFSCNNSPLQKCFLYCAQNLYWLDRAALLDLFVLEIKFSNTYYIFY